MNLLAKCIHALSVSGFQKVDPNLNSLEQEALRSLLDHSQSPSFRQDNLSIDASEPVDWLEPPVLPVFKASHS